MTAKPSTVVRQRIAVSATVLRPHPATTSHAAIHYYSVEKEREMEIVK